MWNSNTLDRVGSAAGEDEGPDGECGATARAATTQCPTQDGHARSEGQWHDNLATTTAS